ncbi:hypothetical protein Tco_0908468 [Tanacetum coccineum]|uniref:Uncharacterized protein n=1 Tax=Tanacetum coccineum TaxID=301880 RepID=A0ABQ5CMY6_9ASTR
MDAAKDLKMRYLGYTNDIKLRYMDTIVFKHVHKESGKAVLAQEFLPSNHYDSTNILDGYEREDAKARICSFDKGSDCLIYASHGLMLFHVSRMAECTTWDNYVLGLQEILVSQHKYVVKLL